MAHSVCSQEQADNTVNIIIYANNPNTNPVLKAGYLNICKFLVKTVILYYVVFAY